MLILTRKLGESITIGDDIKVTVLGVHGRQVNLGVGAPTGVKVHREEVYLKIKEEENKQRGITAATAANDAPNAPPKVLTSAPHKKRRSWGKIFC